MYFKNFFHKISKISIFYENNSPWQGYWFLKAFQNAESPRWTECHAAMSVGGC